MDEELIKDDPLKRPKKITVGVLVFFLAVLMTLSFASFFVLYGEFFTYKANESEAKVALAELRQQIESAKTSYVQEVAAAEKGAADRIRQLKDEVEQEEKKNQERFAALKAEETAERKRLTDEASKLRDAALNEHKVRLEELEASYDLRKKEIMSSLVDFRARFDTVTNNLGRMIQEQENKKSELEKMLADLPNRERQCQDVSNRLVRVHAQLDSVREQFNAKQQEMDALSREMGQMQSRKGSLEGQVTSLQSEVATLSAMTNEIHRTIQTLKLQEDHWKGLTEKAHTDTDAAQQACRDKEVEISVLTEKITKLESEKKEAQQKRDAAASESAVEIAKLETLKGKIVTREDELSIVTNRLASLKAQCDEDEKRLLGLQKQIKQKQVELETLTQAEGGAQ